MKERRDGAREKPESVHPTSGMHETGEILRPSHVTGRPPSSENSRRQRFEVAASQRALAAAEGALEPPSSEELLFTVLELNRTVSVEMQDEAIVHGYVDALRGLFPRRRFAVRLLSPQSAELVLVYATGRLAESMRDRVVLSEEALARHELAPDVVRGLGVHVAEAYAPIFAEPGEGFDIPLTAGGSLAGVMSVEYETPLHEPRFDRSLVVPIAVQLASALRNARLLREANYMRGNLEKLLDHANAPIVVIGRERELRVINRAWLSLSGGTRETLLGRDFLPLLPESERTRILPVFIRALRGESTSNFEVRLPRSDGGYSRLVINTASILAADGEIEGVIAIGRDLTELRELEEQVIQAEKLATLGQLAAGVVHELNNPLTSISVYGEYLMRKGRARRVRERPISTKLQRIVESADRILKFTRDLVTYARPSTEELAFVPIGDVIEQSLLFCDHVVKEASATVVKRFDAADALVFAVRGQLHQVFINLITNACHALPSEGGEIVVSTGVDADEHLFVAHRGQRLRHPQRTAGEDLRALLLHQGRGQGDRSRALDRAQHRRSSTAGPSR